MKIERIINCINELEKFGVKVVVKPDLDEECYYTRPLTTNAKKYLYIKNVEDLPSKMVSILKVLEVD